MEHKQAKTYTEADIIQEKYEGIPHGRIQWKGTDVCMDVHCKCGHLGHVDGWFSYAVKCSNCGVLYLCNGHIELIKIEECDHDQIIETD